jgi:hypothetical protein
MCGRLKKSDWRTNAVTDLTAEKYNRIFKIYFTTRSKKAAPFCGKLFNDKTRQLFGLVLAETKVYYRLPTIDT